MPDCEAVLWDLPLGASIVGPDEAGFKVWAPRCQNVTVVLPDRMAEIPLQQLKPTAGTTADRPNGLHAVILTGVGPGQRYAFRLDGGTPRPDPRSQFQPAGVHGPSQLVDHASFGWSDGAWRGIERSNLVIYELHVGCASSLGTYQGVINHLPRLRDLGVTAIELLPLAETPGRWNWGYDGVHLFAPKAAYGRPEDLQRLVDECHRQGFAVLLDVVYNHLGPEGNYLREFAPYFSRRVKTPWGEALNFSGRDRGPVRRWILDNVRHWILNYRFDGLRLDAFHYLFDSRDPSMTAAIAEEVEQLRSQTGRHLHLIAETNVFDPTLAAAPNSGQTLNAGTAESARGRYTAQWADCLLHALYSLGAPSVKLTNRHYRGATDIGTALQLGYVYQGTRAGEYERADRESSLPKVHENLIVSLQTHDSVGNHPHGRRLHQLADEDFQMAAAGLTLLAPSIPQIFMGEEGAVPTPFRFFTDFGDPNLRAAVDRGRQHEYPHHHWAGAIPPSDPEAYFSSRLPDFANWNQSMWQWYRQLLWIRRAGLAQGWLRVSQARWTVDLRQGYFCLMYGAESDRCRVESWLQPSNKLGDSRPFAQGGATNGRDSAAQATIATSRTDNAYRPQMWRDGDWVVVGFERENSPAAGGSRCRITLASSGDWDWDAFPGSGV